MAGWRGRWRDLRWGAVGFGQFPGLGKTTARPNVGAVDHDRMVKLGMRGAWGVVAPVTSMVRRGRRVGRMITFRVRGFAGIETGCGRFACRWGRWRGLTG